MPKKIIKSDIILFLLVIGFIGIIILFVDFSSYQKKQEEYDVSVYKAYYVYDELSAPISLSYTLINTKYNISKEKIIDKIFNTLSTNISSTLKLLNINIDNAEIMLDLNEDIKKYPNIEIECLVNSILQIGDYKSVNIKYQNDDNYYFDTTEKYYINSPITNKLYSFLYQDKNYKIIYVDELKKEVELTIHSNKDNYVIYNFGTEKQKWEVKRDGLYVNGLKLMSNNFKVNAQDKNIKIISIILEEDNTLSVTIKMNNDITTEIYILKQGLGISYYESRDLKGKIINSYKYVKKVFDEG